MLAYDAFCNQSTVSCTAGCRQCEMRERPRRRLSHACACPLPPINVRDASASRLWALHLSYTEKLLSAGLTGPPYDRSRPEVHGLTDPGSPLTWSQGATARKLSQFRNTANNLQGVFTGCFAAFSVVSSNAVLALFLSFKEVTKRSTGKTC